MTQGSDALHSFKQHRHRFLILKEQRPCCTCTWQLCKHFYSSNFSCSCYWARLKSHGLNHPALSPADSPHSHSIFIFCSFPSLFVPCWVSLFYHGSCFQSIACHLFWGFNMIFSSFSSTIFHSCAFWTPKSVAMEDSGLRVLINPST